MKKKNIFTDIILCVFFIFMLVGCEPQKENSDDLTMAHQAAELRDWSLASRLAQRMLLEEDDTVLRWEAWTLLVLASKNMGDTSWVISSLETMQQEFQEIDKQSTIYQELIEQYSVLGKYEQAIDACMKMLEIGDLTSFERAKFELKIADFSIKLNDFPVAEDMLLACLDRENAQSLHQECEFMLAELYYLSDRQQEALKILEELCTRKSLPDEQKAITHFLRADILELQGKRNEALIEFQLALTSHPNPQAVEMRIKALKKKKTD